MYFIQVYDLTTMTWRPVEVIFDTEVGHCAAFVETPRSCSDDLENLHHTTRGLQQNGVAARVVDLANGEVVPPPDPFYPA